MKKPTEIMKNTDMNRPIVIATVALLALAGCTDERFDGPQPTIPGPQRAIQMSTSTKSVTRADRTGEEAAGLLDNNFMVEGLKSNGSPSDAVEVFRYYSVNYYPGTANTTESNSGNWEYVDQATVNSTAGKIDIYSSSDENTGITPIPFQSIKYWDTDYSQYDFVAFSRGNGTGEPGSKTYARFSEVSRGNIGSSSSPVYQIKGTASELGSAYIADLVTVYRSEDSYSGANPVTPRFRKVSAKVRMAIYETVPGYSVKDVRFYTSAGESSKTKATVSELAGNKPTLLSVTGAPDYKTADRTLSSGSGTISVYFPVTGSANVESEGYNKAVMDFTPDEGDSGTTDRLTFKDLDYGMEEGDESAGKYLDRSSNTATYAGRKDTEDYIEVLPTGEGHVLKLRVAYTLVPTDGGSEIIVMEDATAVVPAQYAEWQPNYAYTYIFKISEKSGEGLYPITFDALVMDSEDGIQETITEVSDPSITTYQKGKIVTENDEYITGDSIFVVVDNGKALSKTDDGVGYVRLFNAVLTPGAGTAPNAATALQSITEATAENCFEKGTYAPAVTEGTPTPATWTVTDAAGATLVLTDMTDSLTIATQIPALKTTNGLTWTVNNAWFEPTAAGYYVFQYETAAAVPYTYEEYKALDGNSEVTEGEFNALADAEKTKTPAKYMYKVIKVSGETEEPEEDDSPSNLSSKDKTTDNQGIKRR